MNERLHPLTLGELFDCTALLYRSRFLVCFGFGVVPAGTVLVFAAAIFVFLAWPGSDTGGVTATLAGIFAWLLLISAALLGVLDCLGATALGFTIPIGILLVLIPGANNPLHAQMRGTILMLTWYGLWFAMQALSKPVHGIALTLFYYDQRIRKEASISSG